MVTFRDFSPVQLMQNKTTKNDNEDKERTSENKT